MTKVFVCLIDATYWCRTTVGDGIGPRQAFMDLFLIPLNTRVCDGISTKNPNGHGLTEDTVKWGWTEVQHAPETKRWLEDFPHKTYRRCEIYATKTNGRIAHTTTETRTIPTRKRRTIAFLLSTLHFINQTTAI